MMKKLLMIIILLSISAGVFAQTKIDKATEEIKKGNITTHVIPMVDDVWGEIDGWVKSPYTTIYPASWAKDKSVLSDGDSFIQMAAVRISTRTQRNETTRTFSDKTTHKSITASQGGEYVSSAYFTTQQGYETVRITLKKRKDKDVAYMDIYFVRLSKNMLITATTAVAGTEDKNLYPMYERYRNVFDYIVYSIEKR